MVVQVNTVSPNANELPDDVEKLKAIIAEHVEALAERDEKIAAQRVLIDHLRRVGFGKKSEKRPRLEGALDALNATNAT